MNEKNQINISKDPEAKKVIIERAFAAPVKQVWIAWTQSELLEQWWAPHPWKAHTKSLDFTEGGHWLYYMEGPDGTRQWSRADYKKVVPDKSFEAVDFFCDEEGAKNPDMPSMHWNTTFEEANGGTQVIVEISFEAKADMEKIMEMGFEQGFTSALGNLDRLLAY